MFLEPTCPFSIRAFGKLKNLLDKAGEDRITVKVHLKSQHWPLYSGVIVRCILAASTLEGGKIAANSVKAAMAPHREEFEFDRHCSGPNLDATPNDIIRRIERYSGVSLPRPSRSPISTARSSWHCKYARQKGIHVSPTFMLDGLVQPEMSGGDPIADWVARQSDHRRQGWCKKRGPRLPGLPIFRGTRESNLAKREKSSAVDAGPQPPARASPRI